MAIPKAVIVGRPNVGKSSLFNWLVGQRIAIVDPTAGVTRDRVSFILEYDGQHVEIMDTGGMGIEDIDGLTKDVERQISIALTEADVVLYAVDALAGRLPLDQLVEERVRRLGKPTLMVCNKCDHERGRLAAEAEFGDRGWPVVYVSAAHSRGRDEFWAAFLPMLEKETVVAPVEMKLAVVGKRNAGKSTFINSLAGTERVIVSEVAGTTRDSVDIRFDWNGRVLVAIDTAGLRKKSSLGSSVEFYAYSRAERTIRRADVVLLFIDATEETSQVDRKLAGFIALESKPCAIVVNKWDLAGNRTTKEFSDMLSFDFPTLRQAARIFITAKTGRNVARTVDLAWRLHQQARTRVGTGVLNRVLKDALAKQSPPFQGGRALKVFYATQASITPPTIVIFCNDPKLVVPVYRRYLMNYFRDHSPFREVPIKMLFRRRDGGLPGDPEHHADFVPGAAELAETADDLAAELPPDLLLAEDAGFVESEPTLEE